MNYLTYHLKCTLEALYLKWKKKIDEKNIITEEEEDTTWMELTFVMDYLETMLYF